MNTKQKRKRPRRKPWEESTKAKILDTQRKAATDKLEGPRNSVI